MLIIPIFEILKQDDSRMILKNIILKLGLKNLMLNFKFGRKIIGGKFFKIAYGLTGCTEWTQEPMYFEVLKHVSNTRKTSLTILKIEEYAQ